MVVGFEVNNKIMNVNIKTPLEIMSKEDYEAEYGEKYSVNQNIAPFFNPVYNLTTDLF